MNFAIIKNNIVENVIVADEQFATNYADSLGSIAVPYEEFSEDDTLVARIGEGYIQNKFISGNQAVALGLLTVEEAKSFGFHSGQEYVEPKVATIDSITMRQVRLQLLSMGLLDQIDAIVADNKAYQIEWEYATEIKKDNLLVQGIVQQLGLTSEQLDTMFLEASKL